MPTPESRDPVAGFTTPETWLVIFIALVKLNRSEVGPLSEAVLMHAKGIQRKQ